MRRQVVVAIGLVLLGGQARGEEAPAPGSVADRESYAAGVTLARSVTRDGLAIDPEWAARGLRDGLSGGPLLLGDADLRAAQRRLEEALRRRGAGAARAGAEAKRLGAAFLAENARKEGVVTLPSGLQYRVLEAGDGQRPTEADRVVCHYRGTLIDGTEFDSSYGRGRPATFDVAAVVPGWREALELMPVGSKWQLFVPPELAYGERGMRGRRKSPARIGPNATLVFEIELLDVRPAPRKAAAPPAATAEAASAQAGP